MQVLEYAEKAINLGTGISVLELDNAIQSAKGMKLSYNNIIIEKEGTEGYNKLVNLLSDYLEDYIMEDKVVGKRIYAPNILVIKNKTIKGVITGISDMQKNANDELTNEIKEDSYNKIYNLLKEYNNNSCSSLGC